LSKIPPAERPLARRHHLVSPGDIISESAGDFVGICSSGLAVKDVKVRILGDVAIIHARTSYTTAEGEQRNGRYTDVWARRDGKWLAVSAHVTR
jgi:ketosteroid isomerase-like protein